MNLLFIDANIYLRFYDTSFPDFKMLLNALIGLKDRIFITTQIVDEVTRNKAHVVQYTIEGYIQQAKLLRISVPEQLNEELKEWNKDRHEQTKIINQQNAQLRELLGEIFRKVAISEDEVSIKLNEIFLKAKSPGEEIIRLAKRRKEIGNPPGKPNDPLGDQISWELLLANVKTAKKIWVISNDSDFFVESDKQLFLNPLLYQELRKINESIQVKCFKKLSEGLLDYQKEQAVSVKDLPDKDTMQSISEAEEESITPTFNSELLNTSSLIRLSKAARNLNVGITTIVDYFHSQGITIDYNPNYKLTPELYEKLVLAFKDDRFTRLH